MKTVLNKQAICSTIVSGLLLAYSAAGHSNITIRHGYANDVLPVYVYTVDSNGACTYKDEDRVLFVEMAKAGVTHKADTYSVFRLGIDTTGTKYCVKALYSETYPNDNCKFGPINNVKQDCTFTLTKPAGNKRTPGIYVPDTSYAACGTIDMSQCQQEG